MKNILTLIISVSCFTCVYGQYNKSEPLAHTYSIVAWDPDTGEMAVAVQSHWFSVGSVVSWGRGGVGVVATQSFVNKSFGLRGLDLLKQGKSPQEAIDILLSDDAGKEVRQLAILDFKGQVAAFTGKNCIEFASDHTGEHFSVQANMMRNDRVVPAMKEAFENASNMPLAERVLEALKAAEDAGGDIRGKQSAALLVVSGTETEKPWDERLIDLRVDDHEDPLDELERLLKVHRAFQHMNNGDLFIEKNDMAGAMKEYNSAMKLFPDNLEMQYWTAITLANNKEMNKALEMLKKIYAADPSWRELTKRLPKSGLLNVSESDFKKLLE